MVMFDVAIVGAGPAGLQAATFAGAEGLRTVIFDPQPGGACRASTMIENLLGYPEPISGMDLADRAEPQLAKFGVEVVKERVMRVEPRDKRGFLITSEYMEDDIFARAVIIATGLSWRKLPIPGSNHIIYGDQIDLMRASVYQDKKIAIVGGGNSAAQALLHLKQHNCDTSLIVRGDTLTASMSAYLVRRIEEMKIRVLFKSVCNAVMRNSTKLVLTLSCDNEPVEEDFDAVLAFIGGAPATAWLSPVVRKNDKGFILTDNRMMTTPGVFAIGDVRADNLPRIAAAMGDGARVISHVLNYLATV